MTNDDKVRVRFPPSPTGYCHIGTARMALVNYLFAKKHGGTIVLRIEDTDKARSKREYEDDIKESLSWLGLQWDEFARQSERLRSHTQLIGKLVREDKAYVSDEESKTEPGQHVRPVRLRNPGKTITFTDIIRGEITFDTTELGDFVIARGEEDPLYNFAVVVDDAEMGITHVIRGEDHISNTPRQILIQEALGYPRPQYAHFPLHLAADRSKLSKRKGDVAVRDYRAKGYLPDALLNYLAVVGWTAPSGKEILSLGEMIDEFELADVHKSGGVFDPEKLRWYNRRYLATLPDSSFAAYALPALERGMGERVAYDATLGERLLPLLRERIDTAADIAGLAHEGELDFFFSDPAIEAAGLPDKKSSATEAARHLLLAKESLLGIEQSEWSDTATKSALWEYATAEGRGAVLWPLRYALSGRSKSPDPFTIAGIIGKAATLRRIETALAAVGQPV